MSPASPADVVDEALVEQAVVWIRNRLASTLFKGMTEIGDYVFDRFFGADMERVRSRSHTKNASFRSLVARCETAELPLGRSTLHRAVGISLMQRLLPDGGTAFNALSPTHQVALLPLRDPARVEKLAAQAVSHRLSVSDVRQLVVREVAEDAQRRTRRHKPLILKTIDRSLKIFTRQGGRRAFTNAHVDELRADELDEALRGAGELLDSLQKLIEKLSARR
jgi:hypothetical protein